MRRFSTILVLTVFFALMAKAQTYTPDRESLSKHTPVPEWMRDAKFGIYCHWSVYTVPAYGNEQYFHYMHQNDSSENFLMGTHRQHVARFGSLEKIE